MLTSFQVRDGKETRKLNIEGAIRRADLLTYYHNGMSLLPISTKYAKVDQNGNMPSRIKRMLLVMCSQITDEFRRKS